MTYSAYVDEIWQHGSVYEANFLDELLRYICDTRFKGDISSLWDEYESAELKHRYTPKDIHIICPDAMSLNKCLDKNKCGELIETLNIPTPKATIVNNIAALEKSLSNFNYPLFSSPIVQPLDLILRKRR